MFKRVCAALTAVLLLVCLTACDSGTRNGQVLDTGWIVRGDAEGIGESENWHKGFTEANDVTADTLWYANTFAASLVKGDRVILSLCDLGQTATVWLNGRQVDTRDNAMGDYLVDVTDAVKPVGTNTLVIRAAAGAAVARTTLAVRSAVMVSQLAVASDAAGNMRIRVTLDNTEDEVPVVLTAVLTALDTGKVMTRQVSRVQAVSGVGVHDLTLTVDDAVLWDITRPYLYDLTVTAASASSQEQWRDSVSETVGFRAQTSVPDGVIDLEQTVMQDEAAMREFVNRARTEGVMAVRPLGGPTQALLDYADELGMLVITDAGGNHVSAISDGGRTR